MVISDNPYKILTLARNIEGSNFCICMTWIISVMLYDKEVYHHMYKHRVIKVFNDISHFLLFFFT